MAPADPELDAMVRRLTAIAAEPLQQVARTLAALTAELENTRSVARLRRGSASSPEQALQAAVDDAYAAGAIAALEAVASALFGGLAKLPRP